MKTYLTVLVALMLLTVGSAHAAVLSVPDYTLVPDGTEYGSSSHYLSTEDQRYDVNANNGGTIVNAGSPVAYYVTTFEFGAGTSADIYLNFTASVGQDRLGLLVRSNGTFVSWGDGTNGTDLDLGSSLAGETITIIGKFEYDANNSDTYGQSNASNDSFATFWINPTPSSTEGSGLPDGYEGVANANFAGDFASNVWNSSSFYLLKQRIDNNSTLAGNGSSSILNTTVLTGSDATFANALALATVPEPASLATGLLGLTMLVVRRRR